MNDEANETYTDLGRRAVLFSCASSLLLGAGVHAVTTDEPKTSASFDKGVVSPRAFGALSSATPSGARVDQTAHLQAALDFLARSTSGGTLLLDGWYAVAGLKIPSNIAIIGQGQTVSGFVKFGRLSGAMVTLAAQASHLLFQDLGFDGQNGTETEALFAFGTDAGSFTTFRRVTFQEGCARAAVRADWSSPQQKIIFDDCRFTNLPCGGVQILPTHRGCEYIHFERNIFERVGASAICIHHGGSSGDAEFGYNKQIYVRGNRFVSPIHTPVSGDAIPVEIWGWDGGECVDNYVNGGTRGLSAGAGGRNILYARNFVANQTLYAFECGKMRSCAFRNNVVMDCPSMFAFTGGGEYGFDIFDVIITNNRGTGTGLSAPAIGMDYIGSSNDAPVARNLRITGNVFSDLEYIRTVIRIIASKARPVISIKGDGKGAIATATLKAVGARIIDAGTGYKVAPKITVSGGGGTGAAFECTLGPDGSISTVKVVESGTGYTSAPDLTLSGSGDRGATLDANMGIERIHVEDQGAGYSHATIDITNNGGSEFRGAVSLSRGAVTNVVVIAPGHGFGRGSSVVVEDNKYLAGTYNSCANGYYIDGANIIVRENLWRRTAMFDRGHYQGNDAVAFRQTPANTAPGSPVAIYSGNSAEMLGKRETGSLISFGFNSPNFLAMHVTAQKQNCSGPFSGGAC